MWRCLSSALYAPTPPYTSARFADIRCHIASAHPTIRFWMCPHPGCGFGCKTDKAFFAHCMAAQGLERPLTCVYDDCDASFKDTKYLVQHIGSTDKHSD
jgi:hypothetical protein